MEFIKNSFPNYYEDYLEIYRGAFAQKEFAQNVYQKIGRLKQKYNLNSNYKKFLPKETAPSQLELFS